MKILLQNIRSVHNVGSIFRTADAVGVTEILLGGYTPGPVDRYGDTLKAFSKVSLGAEKSVKFRRVYGLGKFLEQQKALGVKIIALELDERSVDYAKFNLTSQEFGNCILILGNEKRGLSKLVLDSADAIIQIPMRGIKESLNVSVAFAVAAFALRDNGRKC